MRNSCNDYSEGAHPSIIELLQKYNFQQHSGYEYDDVTKKAKDLIKGYLGNDNVDIYFVSGGTQANLIILASMMKPFESVIAVKSAHINMHEAGAIEATGHKVNTVVTDDGKIKIGLIDAIVREHADEHMVKPKVVFISNSTELGTVYYKKELEELSEYCKKHDLYLYLDGARLGSALTSENNDVEFSDLVSLTDAFYIGGTKNGALFGEAIVLVNDELKLNFIRHIKQRGGLLAKGMVFGAQFEALFKDDLYLKLARKANEMAKKLTMGISNLGCDFLTGSKTNQIFPIFENRTINELQKSYGFYVWSKVTAEKSSIRLVTSWATEESKIDEFLIDLKNIV